jgi:hypothetical protein
MNDQAPPPPVLMKRVFDAAKRKFWWRCFTCWHKEDCAGEDEPAPPCPMCAPPREDGGDKADAG